MPILSYFPSGGGGEVTVTLPTVPSQEGELIYTGESLTPTWKDYDPEELNIGGVFSAVNAGNHYATFTPKSGYCWDDLTVEPHQVLWTVNKAEGGVTASVSSVSLNTVSNKTVTFSVERLGDGVVTVKSSNTSVATVSLSGSLVTVTSNGAGTAVITLSVAEGTNHTATSVDVDVTSVDVWKKYSYTTKTTRKIWVPSFECTPEELVDLEDSGDIVWDEDFDEYWGTDTEYSDNYDGWSEIPSSSDGAKYYAYVSLDSDGNIVGGTTVDPNVAYYAYANGSWYYVGDSSVSSSGSWYVGDMFMFELEVKEENTYTVDSYIEDVTSTDPNAYPDGEPHTDGFWYIKIYEGFYATDDGNGNVSIFNATVTDDGGCNLTIKGE